MKRALFIIILLNVFAGICLAEIKDIEPLHKGERILILSPHPDDEAIGCSGIIQEALKKSAAVHIVYLTNGDHNQFSFIVYEKRLVLRKGAFIYMGEVRKDEAIKAMQSLGLNESNLTFLGYPDFGTLAIFRERWKDAPVYKNLLTRISRVPYKDDLSFGAPYKGESILKDLETMLLKYRPHKIFASHPADTNVDHKAAYLFLQVALADLEGKIDKPKVYPYLVHALRWPETKGFKPDSDLKPPESLTSQISWLRFNLDAAMIEKKKQAILSYKSQTEVSATYLLSFARTNELFGDYPEYNASFAMFADSFSDIPEHLENLFEGNGSVTYAVQEDALLIKVAKSKHLNQRFSLSAYIFGYNSKVPFSDMPKIRIVTLYNRFKVFNQRKRIKQDTGISVSVSDNQAVLKVPLKFLGDPDFILSSVKTYAGQMPVNSIGFHKIYILKDDVALGGD